MTQRLKKLILPSIIISLILLFVAQCSVGRLPPVLIGKKVWLIHDQNFLREEIRRLIPVGSSITDAKWLFEFNGFECVYTKDSELPSFKRDKQRSSKDGDYLFCYLEVSMLVCAETFKPFVYYKNEIVTDVDAAVGEWCL
jgi:hypothetical protein